MTIKASAWGNYTIPLGGLVPIPEEVVVVGWGGSSRNIRHQEELRENSGCTHKARRGGKGCLGWSAAARGQARTSGSAGSGSASGPCSVCFLSLDGETREQERQTRVE